jgi:hypothetical protein
VLESASPGVWPEARKPVMIIKTQAKAGSAQESDNLPKGQFLREAAFG